MRNFGMVMSELMNILPEDTSWQSSACSLMWFRFNLNATGEDVR